MKGEKQNMNKLLTKIAKALVGLSMAIGVGVAVGSHSKTEPVYAAAGSTLTFTITTSTSGYPSGYGTNELTLTASENNKKTLTVELHDHMKGNGGMQAKANSGSFRSTSTLDGYALKSIAIANVSGQTARTWAYRGGTTEITSSSGGSAVGSSSTSGATYGSGTTYTSANYPYKHFYVYRDSKNANYAASYTITYVELATSSTCTVTYHDNKPSASSGSVTGMPSTNPVTNVPTTSPYTPVSTYPSLTGYTCLGWNTDSSATTSLSSVSLSGNTDLYAIWQGNYTVTYYANKPNGATGTVDNLPAAVNHVGPDTFVPTTDLPTLTGYECVGWNTDSSASSGLSSVPVSGNVSLYAIWKKTGVLIWHNATIAKGDTNSYDNNTINDAFTIKMGKSSGNGNMTLTVGAEAIRVRFYCAAWNNEGGSSNPISVTGPSGVTISPSPFNPVASSALQGSGSSFTISNVTDYLVTLTLSNVESQSTLTLTSTKRAFVWGAEYATEQKEEADVTLSPESLSLSAGGEAGTITATPNEYLTNAQYVWGIKNTSDDCVTLSSSTNVATVTPKNISSITASAVITLTVTSSSDNQVNISKEIPVSVAKVSSSTNPYSVADAKAAIDANVGKTGAYVEGIISQIDSYSDNSITYWISDDGLTSSQLEVYKGKGLNGANFSALTDLILGQHVTVHGNLTFYSTGSIYEFSTGSSIDAFDSHTVTFDAGEGTVSPTSATVTCGGTTTLPTPTRSGYTFDGWLKNNSGNPIAAGSTTDRIVADTTYVAKWSMVQTLASISLSGTYTTSFPRNSQFNHNGVVVTAHYEEQDAEDKTVTSLAQFSSPDMTTTGTKTVTVTYSENEVEVSATYTITVTGIITGITTDMPANLTLDLLESSAQYSATVQKDEGVSASVVWLSSDPSVATVSNGTITALSKVGTTTITVFADANGNSTLETGEFSSTCSVKVVDPNALTDTLTYSLIGVTGSSYSPWSGKTDATSAVYAGTTAGGNTSIQMNSGYGIRNTESAGYVRQVVVTFNSNTSSDRSVNLYGYTTAQESISSSGQLLGSASYNGTDPTVTINVNGEYEYEYFVLTSSKAIYLDEVVITYEKIDTSPAILLIGDTVINGKEGTTDSTSLTVKVKNIADPDFTFTYEEDGETTSSSNYISVEEGTPTDGVYPLIISLNDAGTSKVHIDVSGQTASFTVTVVEVSYVSATLPAQYRLVTDDSSLRAGDQIVIADVDKIMTTTFEKSEYSVETDVTIQNGKILTLPSGALVLTLGGNAEDGWTLSTGTSYLVATAAKKISLSATASTWESITIDSTTGTAEISFSESYGKILHNVNSNRFTTYTSSPNVSMTLPKIYRYISGEQNVEVDSDILSAISSARSAFTCNAQGTSFDGTAFNSMASYFTDVICGKYFLDYADSKENGNIVEQWLAMYDYAVGKYGEDYDFLGRISSGKVTRSHNGVNLLFANATINSVAIIVIISMVSVTAIGGYFFLRKRKENI